MNPIFALFGMGGGEIILVVAVVVLLFGARKIPGLARGIGQSIKEFKKASRDETVKDSSAKQQGRL